MPSRLNWCPQEQNLLKHLKEEQKISSWKKIAQILNQKFLDSSRSGKQCRDRYINYVRFNQKCPKIVSWSPEQDKVLFDKFQQFGAKWVQISSEMPGRSQNNLKNRFYGAIRKIMRKIAKVEKDMKPKPKKTIKQKQLIKVFEECRVSQSEVMISQLEENSNEFPKSLYNKLISLAISQQQEISLEDVKTVIKMIHQFNNGGVKISSKTKCPSEFSTEEDISKQSQTVQAQNAKEVQDVRQWKQNNVPNTLENQEGLKLSCFLSWQQPKFTQKQFLEPDFSSFWSLEDELNGNFNEIVSDEFILEAAKIFF